MLRRFSPPKMRDSSGLRRLIAAGGRCRRTRLSAGDISRADRDQIQISADRFEWTPCRRGCGASGPDPVGTALGCPGSARHHRAVVHRGFPWPGRPAPGIEPSFAGSSGRRGGAAGGSSNRGKHPTSKALRVPDPTVLAQYEREPPDQTSTVGFGVSFPLPLWNRNRGGISAAEADYRQAETRRGERKRKPSRRFPIARREFEAARIRADRYSTRSYRSPRRSPGRCDSPMAGAAPASWIY